MTTEQPKPRKLLDRVRDMLRVKHYSIRTEKSYLSWIRRYILFHAKRHPAEMGAPETRPELVEGSKPSSPTWPWTENSLPPRRILALSLSK